MKAASQSSSALFTGLLFGAARKGTVVGGHELLFGDYVVSITAPGEPRLPNGIECRVTVLPSARVMMGGGTLVVGRTAIAPGRPWDPAPAFDPIESLPAGPEPMAGALRSWAPNSAVDGDPLLAGYVAGLVLLHSQKKRAEQIAARVVQEAGPLSATQLRHAALGEVPEPVHALLARGDAGPLLACGAPGISWLRGLISAGLPFDPAKGILLPAARTPALHRR